MIETKQTRKEPLSVLSGLQLSSVTFVMDYIQLGFADPYLTAITLPTVVVGDKNYKLGDAGYRDKLCERIGKTVRQACVIEEQEIRLEFEDGANVLISLRPDDYETAEAATFSNGSELWVW